MGFNKFAGAVAALLVAAGSAQAGVLTCPVSATSCTPTSFSVTDTFTALTSPPFVVYGGLDSFTFGVTSAFNLSLIVTVTGNVVGELFGPSLAPIAVPFTTTTFTGLAAGAYTYTLLGTGLTPGTLNLTATITAVPEAQTYAMLLAGLVVIGVVSRRRRQPVRRVAYAM